MMEDPSELRGDATLLGGEIRRTEDDWQETYTEPRARQELEELLARGPLEPLDQTNLLSACAGRGFVNTVNWLLEQGWKPRIDRCDLDLENDEDRVGFISTSVFHEAAGSNQTQVLDLLWNRGYRFTNDEGAPHWANGDSPLEWAAYFGAKDGIVWLLEHEHPVNAQGHTGWTALMALLLNAKDTLTQDKLVACAQVLLKQGADVSIENNDGHSVATMVEQEDLGNTPLGQVLMAAVNRQRLGLLAQTGNRRKPGGPGRL